MSTPEVTEVKRKITFFKNVGASRQIIESSAGTFGALLEELPSHGIEISDMKVVVAGSNVTLESKEAVVPLTDTTLFLFPKKVKSGCFSDDDDNPNSGTAASFDYDNDNVADFDFANPTEEAKVRLTLIIRGSEQQKEHAEAVLALLDESGFEQTSAAAVVDDPEIRALSDEANRIANSFQ